MAYWAKINENNVVVDCIVADQSFILSGAVGNSKQWVECLKPSEVDINSLAGKSAGVGSHYDPQHTVFYDPKPFPSWSLDKNTWEWVSPVPHPDPNKFFAWDEKNQQWIAEQDCCHGEYQDIHQ